MRLLIAKLASASVQSVSVAMNSEHDIADIATDLDNCVRLLRHSEYDLVVLIVSQGRLRARDAIARMRREAGRVPMMVLTEPGDVTPLVEGLATEARHPAAIVGPERGPGFDAGVPDWEMRQYAVTGATRGDPPYHNRLSSAPAGLGGDGSIVLLPDSETLRLNDRQVPLSQAEYRLFAAMWGRRGQVVPAEDLLTAIYRDGERPTSRVLPVFLFKLRKKLRDAGLGEMIETAIGRGFTIRNDAPQSSPLLSQGG